MRPTIAAGVVFNELGRAFLLVELGHGPVRGTDVVGIPLVPSGEAGNFTYHLCSLVGAEPAGAGAALGRLMLRRRRVCR